MNNRKGLFLGETKILSELCDSITDCHHSTPKWTDNGRLVIRNFNIKKGRLSLSDPSFTNDETFNERIKRKKPESGDLIITREAPMGEVCIIPEGLECCLGQRMVLLKPNKKKVLGSYLLYALQSEFVQTQIQKSDKTGSIVSNLRIPDLEQLNIPVFDTITQEKIGSILKNIDSKIEINNSINAVLEEMAKTIYNFWFVQFDFPISAEQAASMGKPQLNGKPYKTNGGKMVWNEELKREIPEGWEVKNLTKEMDLQYGFPFSTELFNDNGIGVPVIRIRDILNCSISNYSTEEVDDKYRINKGDIIVGMDGNFHINYWNRDNCYLNQRSLRIRSNNGSISEIQARYSIEPFIQAREKNVSRTTVAHLSAKDVNDLKILKADNDFQTKANNCFKSILEKLVSNRIQNQKLADLRDWLLPMLMNGQVRVG